MKDRKTRRHCVDLASVVGPSHQKIQILFIPTSTDDIVKILINARDRVRASSTKKLVVSSCSHLNHKIIHLQTTYINLYVTVSSC
jgi:hypothetical protein